MQESQCHPGQEGQPEDSSLMSSEKQLTCSVAGCDALQQLLQQGSDQRPVPAPLGALQGGRQVCAAELHHQHMGVALHTRTLSHRLQCFLYEVAVMNSTRPVHLGATSQHHLAHSTVAAASARHGCISSTRGSLCVHAKARLYADWSHLNDYFKSSHNAMRPLKTGLPA